MNTDKPRLIAAAISATLAVAVLGSVLWNDLVWDDRMLITMSSAMGKPDQLLDMLASPFWNFAGSGSGAGMPEFWRPLTTLMLWTAAFLGDKSPWVFHLFSLLALISTAVALGLMAIALFPSSNAQIAAVWVGLLYLIHPLSVEVFCMAANMADHLSLTFLLLSLILTIRILREPHPRRGSFVALSLIVFLSACSKEFGVAGAAAPLAGWLLLRSVDPALSMKKIANLRLWIASVVPVAIFLLLRHQVLNDAVTSDKLRMIPIELIVLSLGASMKQIVTMVPAGAQIIFPVINPIDWLLSAAAMIAYGLLIVRARRTGRMITLPVIAIPLGWFLFLLSLFGAGFTPGNLIFPTRYIHLLLAGTLLSATPFLIRIWTTRLYWLLISVMFLMATLSFVRISEWRNDLRLYGAEMSYQPGYMYNFYNYTQEMFRLGLWDVADKEISIFEKTRNPLSDEERMHVAAARSHIALRRDRNYDLATKYAQEALSRNIENVDYLLHLARIRDEAGRPEEALWLLNRALGEGRKMYSPEQLKKIEMKRAEVQKK